MPLDAFGRTKPNTPAGATAESAADIAKKARLSATNIIRGIGVNVPNLFDSDKTSAAFEKSVLSLQAQADAGNAQSKQMLQDLEKFAAQDTAPQQQLPQTFAPGAGSVFAAGILGQPELNRQSALVQSTQANLQQARSKNQEQEGLLQLRRQNVKQLSIQVEQRALDAERTITGEIERQRQNVALAQDDAENKQASAAFEIGRADLDNARQNTFTVSESITKDPMWNQLLEAHRALMATLNEKGGHNDVETQQQLDKLNAEIDSWIDDKFRNAENGSIGDEVALAMLENAKVGFLRQVYQPYENQWQTWEATGAFIAPTVTEPRTSDTLTGVVKPGSILGAVSGTAVAGGALALRNILRGGRALGLAGLDEPIQGLDSLLDRAINTVQGVPPSNEQTRPAIVEDALTKMNALFDDVKTIPNTGDLNVDLETLRLESATQNYESINNLLQGVDEFVSPTLGDTLTPEGIPRAAHTDFETKGPVRLALDSALSTSELGSFPAANRKSAFSQGLVRLAGQFKKRFERRGNLHIAGLKTSSGTTIVADYKKMYHQYESVNALDVLQKELGISLNQIEQQLGIYEEMEASRQMATGQ